MKKLTLEPFVDGYVFLEGPRWYENRLWVSDVWAHKVYAIEADGRAEVAADVPNRPSGLGFMPDGTPLATGIEQLPQLSVFKQQVTALELQVQALVAQLAAREAPAETKVDEVTKAAA